MTSDNELLLAKNFSHLFSDETLRRKPSPIKTTMAYFQDPDVIFLGAGMPPAELFPLKSITIEIPKPPFSDGIDNPKESFEGTIMKNPEDLLFRDDIPLARALQYGNSRGQKELVSFLKEHTSIFHSIPYNDWDIITTAGSTQAWDASLRIFCNKGDTVLLEEFTYSSSVEAADAQGLNCIPVPMDNQGIIPEKLEEMLSNWTDRYPGIPMPKLLYTIPTGQNPTGCTLSECRKPCIYQLAQKHDILIVEDDPYYFLQMGTYVSPDKRETDEQDIVTQELKQNHGEFVKSLSRSFLDLDRDGRVIRLDSMSKTFAPGCRLGWIVGSKHLLDNYWNLHEVSIQSTCGFAQSILGGLLNRWDQDGYINWLIELRHEYTLKRNWCLDSCYRHLPQELVTLSPPSAGMFFTVSIDSSRHPHFCSLFESNPSLVEQHIYEKCVANGVLVALGSWFKVNGPECMQPKICHGTNITFRGTFAAVDPKRMEQALKKFGETLREEFEVA